MGTDTGPRKVVGDALAAASGALAEQKAAAAGVQVAMFPVPGAATSDRAVKARTAAAAANKRGRPSGGTNKSTKELREYLLVRGVHPLQRMMEWMLHTPDSLARELGCKPIDAAEWLRKLWSDAAPYFASRLVPTDDAGRELPFFNLILGGQHAHLQTAVNATPWLDPTTGQPWGASAIGGSVPHEQNQSLSGQGNAAPHGRSPHDDGEC